MKDDEDEEENAQLTFKIIYLITQIVANVTRMTTMFVCLLERQHVRLHLVTGAVST